MHLFISTGKECKMYTLNIRGKYSSRHLKNLSTDWKRAVSKAKEYSRDNSIPLYHADKRLDILPIERSSNIGTIPLIVKKSSPREQQIGHYNNIVEEGVIHVGKYRGHTPKHIDTVLNDVAYLRYLSSKFVEDNYLPFNASCCLAKEYVSKLREEKPTKYIGKVGTLVGISLKLLRRKYVKVGNGMKNVYQFISDNGSVIQTPSHSSLYDLDVGSHVYMVATVISHRYDKYEKNNITTLGKIKTVKYV